MHKKLINIILEKTRALELKSEKEEVESNEEDQENATYNVDSSIYFSNSDGPKEKTLKDSDSEDTFKNEFAVEDQEEVIGRLTNSGYKKFIEFSQLSETNYSPSSSLDILKDQNIVKIP